MYFNNKVLDLERIQRELEVIRESLEAEGFEHYSKDTCLTRVISNIRDFNRRMKTEAYEELRRKIDGTTERKVDSEENII
jgi:hypothetical protein